MKLKACWIWNISESIPVMLVRSSLQFYCGKVGCLELCARRDRMQNSMKHYKVAFHLSRFVVFDKFHRPD